MYVYAYELLAKGKKGWLVLGARQELRILVPTYSLVQWESQSLVVRGTTVGWLVDFITFLSKKDLWVELH